MFDLETIKSMNSNPKKERIHKNKIPITKRGKDWEDDRKERKPKKYRR